MNQLEVIGFKYVKTKDITPLKTYLKSIGYNIGDVKKDNLSKNKVKIKNSRVAIRKSFKLRHSDKSQKQLIKKHIKRIKSLIN